MASTWGAWMSPMPRRIGSTTPWIVFGCLPSGHNSSRRSSSRNMLVRLDCGSRSAAITSCPMCANIHARWYTRVVLPTPPLLLKNAIVFIWALESEPTHSVHQIGIQPGCYRFASELPERAAPAAEPVDKTQRLHRLGQHRVAVA